MLHVTWIASVVVAVTMAMAMASATAMAMENELGQGVQCSGKANTAAPYTAPPQLVASTTNGKKFVVGPTGNQITVVHLYGTPYEMGVAAGTLLKQEIINLYDEFLPWVEEQALAYAKHLPRSLVDIITDIGIEAGLEMEVLLTEKYTPKHFVEEMKGIADGAGLTYNKVHRYSMFPELIKAACTIIAGWGNATKDGSLTQVRALDWGVDNPMRYAPITFVYHPEAGQGNAFMTQGFPGFVGAITGYSTETAICEKVWIHSNETILQGRPGYPWHFLLRDILQFDSTIAEATARMQAAKRTASIFVGVGSRVDGQGRIFEYSYDQLNEFDWNTPFPGYAPTPAEHPAMTDLVYVDKHSQPSSHPCTASLLDAIHGDITPEAIEQDFVSWVETGDMMIAVYDFGTNSVDVSVASQDPEANPILKAYERQFIRYDMAALFAEPRP
ncbi:uncharacterized protein AMSG_04439 [Thecamonas trahens ATCC 50062]|uniref:Uncharacterized protein n=1 Tax=Thecamonas trahens ATCC 50062 TaxID=461836 RepID=A0A0L0D7M8_THETB|nr:hypothetical protein AMSG_04439 [Thecamonas trahens ATCC 50062]KNC48210.1 hypothetical protein AMSG_04439 [Thecamonas trahens ATCC 50062]|eukprot:XP_013758779.1 hypothetical protein AMSG_04439 [Thecamonas trahens ATCC 50062]